MVPGETGDLENKEGKHDPAAAGGTMDVGERKSSEELEEVIHVVTEHETRDRPGAGELHGIAVSAIEILQPNMNLLVGQDESLVEEGKCAGSAEYNKQGEFKSEVERGCLDSKEENDDLAAVESTMMVQIEKELSTDDMEVFQGETQHGRREQQGDAILQAAIGETVVKNGQTSKEILIEQGQLKEVGYTGISKDYRKKAHFKQVEKGDPEFVEEKHHLSETGVMEGSNAKPSEKVELVSQKAIQNEKREQEGRVVDANRGAIAEFGETKMEVDGGLGQTQAKEAGGYTGDLEECSNQEDLEKFRQEVWQDEKEVHETTEKRHDPAAGGTIESEETKPSENVKEVYEGVTTEHEEKEKLGRGVLQATGDATVEMKQTMEELLVRQCLSQVGEEVFQHASEPERRDHGGEALHTTEETITEIEQTQSEVVEQCQIREGEAKIFEKVKEVFEEIIQHERREQQGGGVLHATVEALAKIGQTAKGINVDRFQTQAKVKTDEKVEVFLEATEPERTEHVEGRVFLAVGEAVTEFGLTKEELLFEHHTQAEQIIPCKKVEVFQGESAHDRREQQEDRVLHAGAESTAEFGKTTEELVVLCQPEAKEVKPDEKADDVFQEATEHERREHLEGGVWHTIVETVGEIRRTTEGLLVEPCQFLAEQAKTSEIVEEVLHAGAEITVEIGQIAEELPVEQCQTRAKEDSEPSEIVEILHAVAETTVEIGQRSEDLPVEHCQTRAQVDSEFPEKVEEVLHAGAETTVEIGQGSEELPIVQCETRAKEDSEPSERIEEHAGAKTTVEIEQISEELPVEQCQIQAAEDLELSEKVEEVLHADAENKVQIGQRFEELPIEQSQTRVNEDSELSEKVEEALQEENAHDSRELQGDIVQHGAETTVEIGQRSEELSFKHCQNQAEDSESSEKIVVFQEAIEHDRREQLEAGAAKVRLTTEQLLGECQAQVEAARPSEEVEEVLQEEYAQNRRVQHRGGELHAGADATVDIGQRSEELPVEHCQTRAKEDFESAGKAEEVLHEGTEHERRVELGSRLLHAIEETADIVGQNLDSLVEQSRTQAEEPVKLSDKVEVFQKATEHERMEQQGSEISLTPGETIGDSGKMKLEGLVECQTELKEADRPDEVKEIFQEGTLNEEMEQAGIVLHNVGETVAEVGKLTKELIESGETQEKGSASTGSSENCKKEE